MRSELRRWRVVVVMVENNIVLGIESQIRTGRSSLRAGCRGYHLAPGISSKRTPLGIDAYDQDQVDVRYVHRDGRLMDSARLVLCWTVCVAGKHKGDTDV